MNRRAFLATVASGTVATLAGCGGNVEHRGMESAPTLEYQEQTTMRTVQTASGAVPEGRYALYVISEQQSVDWSVDVSATQNPVDLFTMEKSEFDRYREGGTEFTYYTSLSQTQVSSATLSGTVGPGDYRFVVDNTGAYGASPDGSVNLDLTWTRELPTA